VRALSEGEGRPRDLGVVAPHVQQLHGTNAVWSGWAPKRKAPDPSAAQNGSSAWCLQCAWILTAVLLGLDAVLLGYDRRSPHASGAEFGEACPQIRKGHNLLYVSQQRCSGNKKMAWLKSNCYTERVNHRLVLKTIFRRAAPTCANGNTQLAIPDLGAVLRAVGVFWRGGSRGLACSTAAQFETTITNGDQPTPRLRPYPTGDRVCRR